MPSCGLVWKQAKYWHKLGLRSPRQFLGPYKRWVFLCYIFVLVISCQFMSALIQLDCHAVVPNSWPYISQLSLKPGSAVNHDVSPHFYSIFKTKSKQTGKKHSSRHQTRVFGRPMSYLILLSGRSLWTIQLPIMGTRFFCFATKELSCHSQWNMDVLLWYNYCFYTVTIGKSLFLHMWVEMFAF